MVQNKNGQVSKRSIGDIVPAGLLGLLGLVMVVWTLYYWGEIKEAAVNNPLVVVIQGVLGMSASVMLLGTQNKQSKIAQSIRYYALVMVLEVMLYGAITYGRWLIISGGKLW